MLRPPRIKLSSSPLEVEDESLIRESTAKQPHRLPMNENSSASASEPTIGGSEVNVPTFFDLALGDWAAIAALVVAFVALFQFWRTVRQNRATILLSLDQRWNGAPMLDARAILYKLMQDVDAEAAKDYPGAPPARVREKSETLFAERLENIHRTKLSDYEKLKRLCGFFEMTGFLTRRRYVPKRDTIDLFGGAILSVGRVFSHHIEHLQNQAGATGKVWEHAVWLIKKTRKVAGRLPRSKYRGS